MAESHPTDYGKEKTLKACNIAATLDMYSTFLEISNLPFFETKW